MKYLAVPLAIVGLAVLAFAFQWSAHITPSAGAPIYSTVSIGTTTISVEIADTQAKRTQGLSGRAGLAEGSGMLFVFDWDATWGFWMKEMRFPLDIIWAQSDGTIVTIAHQVAPETYPEIFKPAKPARYVLEVPSGFADLHHIVEGMKLVL
jgi:uncharacterized membrane protein (UPF0127 family)